MRPKGEADFPRGGKEKLDEATLKQTRKKGKDLFQATDDDEHKRKKKAAKRKASKDKTDPAKKKKTAERVEYWAPNAGFVKVLTHKDLVEGSLVMGCIKNVLDYELKVQFPNNLSGIVPITGLCSAYQELLELAAKGDTSRMEELVTLQDLFHPGQFVVCLVERERSILEGESKITPAKLTLDPRQVNREISSTGLKSGMTLHGFVSSCEDHGYLIDIGVAKVKAFLPKADANRHFKDGLHIGSYLHCLVTNVNAEAMTSGDVRMVTIDIDPKKTSKSSIRADMEINLRTLLPGMSMNVSVQKVADNGVVVKFLEFQGSVHEKHLMNKLSDYSEKQEFRARVLYLQPVTKVVVLTQLKHFVEVDALAASQLFSQMKVGTDIADAAVTKLNKWGAYFSFGENVQGFARKALLTDENKTPVESKFTVGSKHLCRVIGFNYVDNMVLLTAKESDVKRPYFHLENLNPGDKVDAVVTKHLSKDTVQVQVGVGLRGFIHRLHNADVPTSHIDKKFPIGSSIKCRILSVDYEKKALNLTCKGRQLKPSLPLITSFEQSTRGTIAEGCIVDIQSKGCLVVFFNGVKGFAPAGHLNLDEDTLVTDVFFLGQMIKCRVFRPKDDINGMLVSFKLDGDDENNQKKTASNKKEQKKRTGKVECKIVECRVKTVGEESLEVDVASPKATLSLCHEHLTDHVSLGRPLLRSYHAGDQIKVLMWKDDYGLHISAKPSLIHSLEKPSYPKTYQDIEDGNILNGFVQALQDDRILVKLFNGLTVGVHKKFASDEPVSSLPDLLTLGQTLSVCFRGDVLKNGQLARSLRFSHLYKEERPTGDDILESFLSDYQRVMSAMKKSKDAVEKKLAKYHIGQVVTVTIEASRDIGVTCVTEDGVKGFATLQSINEHDDDEDRKFTVGESVQAVVLYVDPLTKCLELSLKKSTYHAVSSKNAEKSLKVLPNQVIRAEVLLIKEDFVLVLLHEHALGRMAFLPAMRNFNDFLEKNLYTIGQVNQAVIKSVTPNGILANLQLHQEKRLQTAPSLITLGKKCKAIVTGFKAQQVNVKVGKHEGRIHVTNIADSVDDGTLLRNRFSEKQVVEVREITNQKSPVGMKEYTTKESLLSTDDTSASVVHSVNDRIVGFVNKVSKNGLQVFIDANTKTRVSLAHSKRSHTDFKSGAAYNFIVKGIFDGQMHLVVDDSSIPKVSYEKGQEVEGVVKFIERKYIRIKLPKKTWGFVEKRAGEALIGESALRVDRSVKCRILTRRLKGKRVKTTWNVDIVAVKSPAGEWVAISEAEFSEDEDEGTKENRNADEDMPKKRKAPVPQKAQPKKKKRKMSRR
ncbi:hypothetical protein CAPTEDRAFT_227890 [Capitella teleta]|uniref:S1 motif domain-containing protein n=1 Tax=Capitella teleta TaxID=283909 RepID=R7TTX1_CAPTE|nr:hypothetical protein CAPTEDRAFT_227890 [Capitella teleta]|eukprot:ELT97129.1 hypothetical protein CAPTEDRAFT_227890 [Capitella teleta]